MNRVPLFGHLPAFTLLAFAASASIHAQTPATPATACPTLLQQSFNRLQDDKPQALCQYAGRVLLVKVTDTENGGWDSYITYFTNWSWSVQANSRWARRPATPWPRHTSGRRIR